MESTDQERNEQNKTESGEQLAETNPEYPHELPAPVEASLVAQRVIEEALLDGSTPDPIELDDGKVTGERQLPAGWTYCGLDGEHGVHATRFGACPGAVPAPPADDGLGTYAEMLSEYLHEQRHWIGPAQTPLVFHLRKIGAQLDARPDAPASLSSAYLQAFRRLDLQRPGHREPAGAGGDLPGQGSIFDELD